MRLSRDSTFFDNTALSSYKDCPRKYYLRHVLDWRSEGTSLPLVFGLAWHSAMDAVWRMAKKVPKEELPSYGLAAFLETWEGQGHPAELTLEQIESYSPRTPSVAHEMLVGYVNARHGMMQSVELLSLEQPFAVPLPQLDNVWYVGRLDKVVQATGQLLVLEHKTTTEYKKDGGFRSTYVEGWYSDSQCKGYQYGGALFFPGLKQVWVDAALVHAKVHNAFRFIPIEHQMPLLQEWITDTKDWIARIHADTARGYFPKNENSCVGKFGACQFLDICRTTSDPERLSTPPAGYVKEKWQPFELLGLDKLTKETT